MARMEKRAKRQATTASNGVIATFVIYLADVNITREIINEFLRDGNATICNGSSCQYKELTIISYPQVDSKANLCDYPEIHKCDKSTTTCEQSGQPPVTYCNCKKGFEPFPSDNHICRDIDECANNATNFCPEPSKCINDPPGSFTCPCNEGQYWDTNNRTCAADGCTAMPCKNGVCFSLKNSTSFACKCNSGWEGSFCENEDAEAYRLKVAVICVSVILGVFCLVLLIILIVICVRQHRQVKYAP
ncbi:unnamed protein product [Candidula unifasciata]|uniref:EGF-like domain-containing protein n=1 Tax=Candidula unifasciata TaxID=100452 RepID=A0A8S3ZZE7_9EUPU|nr:unnamed protein product [Candidula unifasciata]